LRVRAREARETDQHRQQGRAETHRHGERPSRSVVSPTWRTV
jgi:hypothetical protein